MVDTSGRQSAPIQLVPVLDLWIHKESSSKAVIQQKCLSQRFSERNCLLELEKYRLEREKEGQKLDRDYVSIPWPYDKYLRGIGNETDEAKNKVDEKSPKERVHGL